MSLKGFGGSIDHRSMVIEMPDAAHEILSGPPRLTPVRPSYGVRPSPLREPHVPIPPSTRPPALAASRPVRPWHWLALTAVLVAAKLAWLAVDRTPMLFLGDSASYLATAQSGWIPPDRSFLYGFLLQPLALWTGSLLPLLVAQAACGVVAALLLAHLLVRDFAVLPAFAFAVSVLWAALEPLALLYERYVMTEAFALLAFAALVTFSIRYLDGRRLRDLVFAHAMGALLIAFRTMFVPVALAPALAWIGRMNRTDGRDGRRRFAIALFVSLAVTAAFHHAYKTVHDRLGGRFAYSQADGLFLLAAWAPVVRAEDFRDPALGEAVLAASTCKQGDRREREAQRWYPGCLVDVLQRASGDATQANAAARHAALRALRRDPAGVAALAAATWLDGLDAGRVRMAMASDRGDRTYSPATVDLLREHLDVAQAADLHRLDTPTKRWHARAVPWVMLLALVPLIAALAIVVSPPRTRRAMAFVALLAACTMGAAALGGTGTVPRYLHAIAWLAMLPLAVLGAGLARSLRATRRA
jgi:hypothetical protein